MHGKNYDDDFIFKGIVTCSELEGPSPGTKLNSAMFKGCFYLWASPFKCDYKLCICYTLEISARDFFQFIRYK